jgi:hypothetical protein
LNHSYKLSSIILWEHQIHQISSRGSRPGPVPQDLSALWPLHQLQLDLLRWMSSIGEGVMEKKWYYSPWSPWFYVSLAMFIMVHLMIWNDLCMVFRVFHWKTRLWRMMFLLKPNLAMDDHAFTQDFPAVKVCVFRWPGQNDRFFTFSI